MRNYVIKTIVYNDKHKGLKSSLVNLDTLIMVQFKDGQKYNGYDEMLKILYSKFRNKFDLDKFTNLLIKKY